MQRDRHHAPAFPVEHFELAPDHALEFFGRDVVVFDRHLVVDLRRVRNRAQAPRAEIHDVGLVVVHPVGDVLAAELGEVVERMPGLLQARAEPAGDLAPGGGGDALEGRAHHLALAALGELVQAAHVRLVVSHELPAELLRFVDDLRVRVAQLAVQRHGAAHAVARHHLHQAPDADAVAVVARRPGQDIGDQAARAARAVGHALIQRKELDVRDDPHREARAVRPDELRPPRDRRVGKRTVAARLHFRCSRTSSTCITSAYL